MVKSDFISGKQLKFQLLILPLAHSFKLANYSFPKQWCFKQGFNFLCIARKGINFLHLVQKAQIAFFLSTPEILSYATDNSMRVYPDSIMLMAWFMWNFSP